MKVQAESLHLNGHIIGFRPQVQKLESPRKTASTDSGSERFKSTEASFIQLKGVVVKFFPGVFSGLSLTVFSFIYQDNLLKRTMVYWSPNSITPGFHQRSAWRKMKVELWLRHGSVVC